MSLIIPTIQERRARVNVESMVAFNGVDQYASAGVNQNVSNLLGSTKSFSISFFILPFSSGVNVHYIVDHRTNDLGTTSKGFYIHYTHSNQSVNVGFASGTNLFDSINIVGVKPDRISHIVVNFDHTNNTFTGYINSILAVQKARTYTYDFAVTEELTFAAQSISTYSAYGKLLISHLAFFNRTLTHEEIRGMHRAGGLLPESVHSACVTHYPCTEQNGKILNDIVEDYNYAKDPANLLNVDLNSAGWAGGAIIIDGIASLNNDNDGSTETLQHSNVGTLIAGHTYRMEVDVINYVSGKISLNLGSRMTAGDANITGDGTYARTITPTAFQLGGSKYFNITARPDGTNVNYQVSGVRILPVSHPPLDAYPATLENFTDAEVGLPDQSTNTAWRDFYTKEAITVI